MPAMEISYRIESRNGRTIGESKRLFTIQAEEHRNAKIKWRNYMHTIEHGGDDYWNRKACVYYYPMVKEIRDMESVRLGLDGTKFKVTLTSMRIEPF